MLLLLLLLLLLVLHLQAFADWQEQVEERQAELPLCTAFLLHSC
jgi:uncharacterized integral membrane protein